MCISQDECEILSHVIEKGGIHADPEKTSVISNMEPPQSKSDLQRFMGLVSQMGKLSSQIAKISHLLREMLSNKSAWV